jgi:exosortase A-associated hydrolase 1
MKYTESAITFSCHEACLYGILSLPELAASRGVLIVVGGPQYRAGSHRQFTLLARSLAAQGTPVVRFDYRGMGDSEGTTRTFDAVNDDIQSAIDCFFQKVPDMKELVIFGLCDAASAAAFYAHQDRRVSGLVLLNPWVRTEAGIAKAYLKHYYLSRLFDVSLWSKVRSGKFSIKETLQSFLKLTASALSMKKRKHPNTPGSSLEPASLPDRMYYGLDNFQGRVLLILSGNDLTAKEFSGLVKTSKKWGILMKSDRITSQFLQGADHTFSRRVWREQVSSWIVSWLKL